ncbi:DUF805 domain-containing protein [Devosia equisanguinis]|uniref:DUF805 domain-containing protein n=1 Tax=Devosia equisanguinis TaxID=2490941 RepID=UPI0019D05075|nr:DUF805 domain-containing protein [Devosia equisanguinis]
MTFTGRATRAQFWQFVLVVVIMLLAALFLDEMFNDNPFQPRRWLTVIVGVVHFLPFLAFAIRRLHDTDRSGWWYLVNGVPFGQLIFIVFTLIPSTPGPNRYGPPVPNNAPGASWNSFGDAGQAMSQNPYAVAPAAHPMPSTAKVNPVTPMPPASTRPPTATPASDNDLVSQLERLAGLRTLGELTDEEFAAAKTKLIARYT